MQRTIHPVGDDCISKQISMETHRKYSSRLWTQNNSTVLSCLSAPLRSFPFTVSVTKDELQTLLEVARNKTSSHMRAGKRHFELGARIRHASVLGALILYQLVRRRKKCENTRKKCGKTM